VGADWHVDGIALAGDLPFRAYAGVLVMVVAGLSRRSAEDRDGARIGKQS